MDSNSYAMLEGIKYIVSAGCARGSHPMYSRNSHQTPHEFEPCRVKNTFHRITFYDAGTPILPFQQQNLKKKSFACLKPGFRSENGVGFSRSAAFQAAARRRGGTRQDYSDASGVGPRAAAKMAAGRTAIPAEWISTVIPFRVFRMFRGSPETSRNFCDDQEDTGSGGCGHKKGQRPVASHLRRSGFCPFRSTERVLYVRLIRSTGSAINR